MLRESISELSQDHSPPPILIELTRLLWGPKAAFSRPIEYLHPFPLPLAMNWMLSFCLGWSIRHCLCTTLTCTASSLFCCHTNFFRNYLQLARTCYRVVLFPLAPQLAMYFLGLRVIAKGHRLAAIRSWKETVAYPQVQPLDMLVNDALPGHACALLWLT